MLMSRKNQLLLEFSFWNEPVPREGPNIYELRSYQLRVSNSPRSSSRRHSVRAVVWTMSHRLARASTFKHS